MERLPWREQGDPPLQLKEMLNLEVLLEKKRKEETTRKGSLHREMNLVEALEKRKNNCKRDVYFPFFYHKKIKID